MTSRRETEKRIRTLRERLEQALTNEQLALADVILEELETLEPDAHRWPHKRGDVLRRLDPKRATACYERAAFAYASAGFLPRAIAMAKLVVELEPGRAELLERIDPSAARELHRKLRPEGVHVGPSGPSRRMEAAAVQLEPPQPTEPSTPRQPAPTGARRAAARTTLDLDISEVELSSEPHDSGMPSLAPQTELDTRDQPDLDAEREACLPLFPLFAEAPKEALLQLVQESKLVRLTDGAVVVRRGDAADALYGVVDGRVRVAVPGLRTEAQPRLLAGDVFGESCLLSTEPRRADVIAEGDLLALRIPKQTLSLLVRVHESLANVLLELLTRRLVANLLRTSGLFAELSASERKAVAAELELRRARIGTDLIAAGQPADALYITLTGHVEIRTGADAEPVVQGAGVMFGHTTLLEHVPSGIGVRALDTLLTLRLPSQAFSRLGMQYPVILARVSELPEVARVGS